jgi:hypothetical protein
MSSLPAPGVSTNWGSDLNAAIESLHTQGTHAARPTTGIVTGSLYSCSDHGLVYRWDGAAWVTWAVKVGSDGVFNLGARTLIDDGTNVAVNAVVVATGLYASGDAYANDLLWAPDSTRKIVWCGGSPEGVVTAAVGSLALRTDGGASTTLYVKQSGTGNTGWVAK